MSMSKKDFIALADELRRAQLESYGGASSREAAIIDALCVFMRGQNAQFKEQRWRDYLAGVCGPSGGALKRGR